MYPIDVPVESVVLEMRTAIRCESVLGYRCFGIPFEDKVGIMLFVYVICVSFGECDFAYASCGIRTAWF